jgi:uncharacterized pyridoxamine 5'-phosphate oxidase family protein
MNDDGLREEVWKQFGEHQHVFLATDENGQPRVRPVTLIRLQDLYVATSAKDAKISQIRQNPKVEFCIMLEKDGQHGTIRAECNARIVNDKKTKEYVYGKIHFLKEHFKTADDPDFALVALEPRAFQYMRIGSMETIRLKP